MIHTLKNTTVFTRHNGSIVQFLSCEEDECIVLNVMQGRKEKIRKADLMLTKLSTTIADVDFPYNSTYALAKKILEESNIIAVQ